MRQVLNRHSIMLQDHLDVDDTGDAVERPSNVLHARVTGHSGNA
jgi:hypothetical protein